MIIKCPNCEGHGHIDVWDVFPTTMKPIECGWCKGAKVIDHLQWFDYQPHRQRPKMMLDVRLRDGKEVNKCWPNALTFNPMFGIPDGVNGKLSDHRVTHVRISDDQDWNGDLLEEWKVDAVLQSNGTNDADHKIAP